jgi:hypothetical protein
MIARDTGGRAEETRASVGITSVPIKLAVGERLRGSLVTACGELD